MMEQLPSPTDIPIGKDLPQDHTDLFPSATSSSHSQKSTRELTPAMSTSSNQDPSSEPTEGDDSKLGANGPDPQESLAATSEPDAISIPILFPGKSQVPSMRYKLSFRGTYGAEIESKQVESPSQLGKGTIDYKADISPLELIWPIHLAVESWADFEKNRGKRVPPVTASGPYTLKINSAAVIAAIQNTIEYYPGLDASLGSLSIREPFMPLYHYKEDLEKYAEERRRQFEKVPNTQTCERERDLQEHIVPLFHFLDNRPELQQVKLERERHKRGVCTFKMIWVLYKPGTFVYSTVSGSVRDPEALVVKSCIGGGGADHNESYHLTFWCVDINQYRIDRVQQGFQLLPWDGECPIDGLKFVPCDYYKVDEKGEQTEEGKALRQRLVNHGRLFVKQFNRPCLDFDGETIDGLEKVAGRIIADPKTFWAYDRLNDPQYENFESEPIAFVSDDGFVKMPACTCNHCSSIMKEDNTSKSKFLGFDGINEYEDIEDDFEELFFVCTHRIIAFVAGQRVWKRLHISGAREPEWNQDMIDTRLVIDKGNLKTIKALASRYTQYSDTDATAKDEKEGQEVKEDKPEDPQNDPLSKPWAADFIERKGDNAIFLLHGKPGVGKTYTAECVAEFVRRPLLTLTCNDIGTKAEVVEKKLATFFERAKIWGAVILLDEADIYLEKRTLHDLERNGLVSAFLRSLEYFQGILFLTTNRVGTFDDAFLSRIHLPIHYEFDEKERTMVWKMFFDKLESDLADRIEVHESARGFVKHDPDLKSLEWNGREIRNAFQTAVALAESECMREYEERRGNKNAKRKKAVLKRDHFEQVVSMSKNFRTYLFKVHGVDPEKRAAVSKERNEYVRRM